MPRVARKPLRRLGIGGLHSNQANRSCLSPKYPFHRCVVKPFEIEVEASSLSLEVLKRIVAAVGGFDLVVLRK